MHGCREEIEKPTPYQKPTKTLPTLSKTRIYGDDVWHIGRENGVSGGRVGEETTEVCTHVQKKIWYAYEKMLVTYVRHIDIFSLPVSRPYTRVYCVRCTNDANNVYILEASTIWLAYPGGN